MFIDMFIWSSLSMLPTLSLTLQAAEGQNDPDWEAPRHVLQTHLTKYGELTANGEISDIKLKALQRSFPSCRFFTLWFPRYPLEVVPPDKLKPNNVFAVCGEEITLIKDEDELKEFFSTNPPELAGEKPLEDATKSALYVLQELHRDGFFKFKKPVVTRDAKQSEGISEVVAKRGDQGKLTVVLELVDRKLEIVQISVDLRPGIRPRCQATRLLDDDPVIRDIMKRDILVMGSACKSYLDEVRANANPALQRVIDEIWQQIVEEGR